MYRSFRIPFPVEQPPAFERDGDVNQDLSKRTRVQLHGSYASCPAAVFGDRIFDQAVFEFAT